MQLSIDINTCITYLAHFFLFFDQWPFMLGLLSGGFILGNRTLFYHTACITLLSMIINVALKHTFQVPLSLNIGHIGYAFPSGHMQLAAVFYGFLALHTKKPRLYLLTLILLGGIGFGIVHFNYHNWTDIGGAFFFAGFILGGYQLLLKKAPQYINFINAFIATLTMLYIAYQSTIPSYAFMAYWALLSVIIIVPRVTCIHKRI